MKLIVAKPGKARDVRNGNWAGDSVGYYGIHSWLARHHGKANKCEMKDCSGKSTYYEWALLKGKKYQRRRDNFWRLCKSCHRAYDFTKRELEVVANRSRDKNGRFA